MLGNSIYFKDPNNTRQVFVRCTCCKKLAIYETDDDDKTLRKLSKRFVCNNCKKEGKDWTFDKEQRKIVNKGW